MVVGPEDETWAGAEANFSGKQAGFGFRWSSEIPVESWVAASVAG
jgi:hypothetical protein